MATEDEEIEFCRKALESARERLGTLQRARWLRARPEGQMEDATEQHQKVEQTIIDYYLKELAALGVTNA